MKVARFSLADLITLLATLVFGFICFLGLNFLTEGQIAISVVVSVLIAIVLGGLAWFVKSRKKVTRNFKTHRFLEYGGMVLFTALLALASYTVFPHYFTVASRKQEIKDNLLSSINGAKRMFASYETYAENRDSLYAAELNSVVNDKRTRPSDYADYGFGAEGVSDQVQIENKLFTLHADLFPTNYSDTASRKGTKDVAIKWLTEQESVVSQWKPIGIPIVSNEIAEKAEGWLSELIKYSKVREKGEVSQDFAYELSFSDVSPLLTETESPSSIAIIIAVVLWALMLFSWLITKRDSKVAGVKLNRGKKEVADNEL